MLNNKDFCRKLDLALGLILESVTSQDANMAYTRFIKSGNTSDFEIFYTYFIDRQDLIEGKMKKAYGDYAINTIDFESVIQNVAEYFMRTKNKYPNNVSYFWKLVRLRIVREIDKHNKMNKRHGSDTNNKFSGIESEPNSTEDFLTRSPAKLFDIIDNMTMDNQPGPRDVARGFYIHGGRKIAIDNSLLTPREAKALKLSLGGSGRNPKYRSNPYVGSRETSGVMSGMTFIDIGKELGGISGVAVKNTIDKAKNKLNDYLHSNDISRVQNVNEDFVSGKRFNGSFVVNIPFVGVADNKRVRAKVLAEIEYFRDDNGIKIHSYDALEIIPSIDVIPEMLKTDAMTAIHKNIENGKIEQSARKHFENVSGTGQKAAKQFLKPKK